MEVSGALDHSVSQPIIARMRVVVGKVRCTITLTVRRVIRRRVGIATTRRPGSDVRARLALTCLCFVLAGCQTLRRQPVAENMLSSRQISMRGIDASQRGRWDEAEAAFRSAIERCPDYDRAHAGYAEALWQRGERDQAIAHQQRAVQLSGGDPEMTTRLGRMHLEQGEHAVAEHRAEQALRGNKELAVAWRLRGDVMRERGDLDDAIGCYHRALAIQAFYPEVQLALADTYQMQDRPQRALATLEVLTERYGPGKIPSEICERQGMAQKSLGRLEDAARSLLAAGSYADSPEIAFQLAEVQCQLGDLPAARLTVNAALRNSPNDSRLASLAAEIDRRQQRMAAQVFNESR